MTRSLPSLIPALAMTTLVLSGCQPSAPTQKPTTAAEAATFIDHGKVAPVSESRGSWLVRDPDGQRLFLILLRDILPGGGPRTSLWISNLDTGAGDQYFFPDAKSVSNNNYCLFVSAKGRFYLSLDHDFHEFDLKSRTLLKSIPKMNGPAMAMDEDANGLIYFAIYPTSELFSYDPEKGELQRRARLDPAQQYPTSMGIDAEGWIYTGIGTARANLVAWNPVSGERRNLTPPGERPLGTGQVVPLPNGEVYGKANAKEPWQKLLGGVAIPAPDFKPPAPVGRRASLYWLNQRHALPDGTTITNLSLRERRFLWHGPDKIEQSVAIGYETEGASIASLTTGADGKLYGSTDHPMEMWSFDPAGGEIRQLGHDPRIGGGNLTKILPWKETIVGNSYSRGDFFVFDITRPFQPTAKGEEANPKLATSSAPWICRPRSLALHPDGEHVISGGYPGYGQVGGGLLIYNLAKKERSALIPPAELLPDHSIASIAPLPDGDLWLSTSITTPGGATPKAKEALLALFSWSERKILWQGTPLPGAEAITSLTRLSSGLLAGVSETGSLFLFDPEKRQLVRTEQLEGGSPGGRRGDTAFIPLPGGDTVLVMTTAFYRIDGESGTLTRLQDPPVPISNVGPIFNARLYFASAGHLWSYAIPQ